jgi:hypothetical protein
VKVFGRNGAADRAPGLTPRADPLLVEGGLTNGWLGLGEVVESYERLGGFKLLARLFAL